MRKVILLFVAVSVCLLAAARANAGKAKTPPPPPCPAWSDNFSSGIIDVNRWNIADERAPGYIRNNAIGYFDPSQVTATPGMVRLALLQQYGPVGTNPSGIISHGGMIYTKQACGYGTYSWTMKMSSTAIDASTIGEPVSGSVSAGFIYTNNSQTEIDWEFSAKDPDTIYMVNWLNPNPKTGPFSKNETYSYLKPWDSTSGFHTYTFVWSPGQLIFSIDGVWQATHTTNVPSAPAQVMINHWGTNSTGWGGLATVGTTRYMYLSAVSYTPPTP